MPNEAVYWQDAAGIVRPLNIEAGARNLVVEDGRTGWDMPPVALVADDVPLQPGAHLRNVQVKARELMVPLVIYEADRPTLWQTRRQVLQWFDPTRGDGILRVVTPAGDERDLVCRYEKGMEGATGSAQGVEWQRYGVVLYAQDPYWYASLPLSGTFSTGNPVNFFPIFPLRLSPSSISAGATLTNPGDANAWPVWTILGPGAAVMLTNQTSGGVLTLNASIAAGDTVTIDTRPGQKTVTRQSDGANLFSLLDPASSLWPLLPGANQLQLSMVGATSASRLSYQFTPKYLGV